MTSKNENNKEIKSSFELRYPDFRSDDFNKSYDSLQKKMYTSDNGEYFLRDQKKKMDVMTGFVFVFAFIGLLIGIIFWRKVFKLTDQFLEQKKEVVIIKEIHHYHESKPPKDSD